ncbi:DUF805 domain-containing protein [Geodermatophilus sp. URMC 64]
MLVAHVVLVPGMSATVTRLHDRGHSAWWLCWGLVPVLAPAVRGRGRRPSRRAAAPAPPRPGRGRR